MQLGLNGIRVLVGGSSRGIGAATAEVMVQEGAQVVMVARESDELRARAREFGAVPVAVDLSSPSGPEQAVEASLTALGGLDVVVVNSGGPPPGTFEELDDAAWYSAVEMTLMSSVRLVRCALPHIRLAAHPAILFILSSSVREAIAGLDTSNTLRPALAGLVKSLATQVTPVRVNGIAPGRIATDRVAALDARRAELRQVSEASVRQEAYARIPLGRYGEPRELGTVATFLCSPAASYVNGAIVPVDGGMVHCLP